MLLTRGEEQWKVEKKRKWPWSHTKGSLRKQPTFGDVTTGLHANCWLFSQAIMRGCLTGKIWVFWISGRLWEVSFFFTITTHQCKF